MMGPILPAMDLPISPPTFVQYKQPTSHQSSSTIPHRLGSITSSTTDNVTPLAGSSSTSTTATVPHVHLNAIHRSAVQAHYQKQTRVSTWRESVSHVNGTAGRGTEGKSVLQVDEITTPSTCETGSGNGGDSPASLSTTTTASSTEEETVPRMQVPTRLHTPQLQTCGSSFSVPPSRSGSGFANLTPSAGGWQCATARGRSIDRERPVATSCVENVVRSASQPNERQATQCAGKIAQAEQKKALAEKMVDSVHDLLCSTWSSASEASSLSSTRSTSSEESTPISTSECERNGLVPLRMFIREILRRSKSSCGTLRCAEWYLTRLRSTLIPAYAVVSSDDASSTSSSVPCKTLATDSPLLCPRRAFLAALVLAHKFLHDRVYSNRAWAKVSGLDVKEIGRGELALASMLDWNLWVGREEEVAALKADASSAVSTKPMTWFSDVAAKKETMPTPVAPAVPTITSWRAGVRQQSPESVSPSVNALHSSVGGQFVTASPDAMSISRETAALGLGEAILPSQSRYRSCDRASTKESYDSVSPSHTAACATNSQGSSSTILSSCLPGLSLDGRSDFDGSTSVSNISPQSWVLVGIPEVQIMEGVVEEGDDRPRRLSVAHLHIGQGVNPKKRGSPLAADAIAQESTICEHDWVDATMADNHAMKKRKVAVGLSGVQSGRAYFC